MKNNSIKKILFISLVCFVFNSCYTINNNNSINGSMFGGHSRFIGNIEIRGEANDVSVLAINKGSIIISGYNSKNKGIGTNNKILIALGSILAGTGGGLYMGSFIHRTKNRDSDNYNYHNDKVSQGLSIAAITTFAVALPLSIAGYIPFYDDYFFIEVEIAYTTGMKEYSYSRGKKNQDIYALYSHSMDDIKTVTIRQISKKEYNIHKEQVSFIR